VIVVDDGSTDRSVTVARGFLGVSCLCTEPLGQASALNLAVSHSRGELLAFLDADDEWTPTKLELQLCAFSREPSLDVVFGHAEQLCEPGFTRSVRLGRLPARLPSAMLIRRSAFLRVGPFNPQLGLGMVVEWYARLKDARLNELMLDATVYRRWIHGQNSGIRRAAARTQYAEALRLVLERRRGQTS
jgi:glycosyltransferase involved in cell wall biosynthesis